VASRPTTLCVGVAPVPQGLEQGGDTILGGRDRQALADGVALAIEQGDAVVAQRNIDADEAFGHGTPFGQREGTARISRTGATHRGARMAWSIVRDGGEPSPGAMIPAYGYLVGPE
jgi:hypothetical protein